MEKIQKKLTELFEQIEESKKTLSVLKGREQEAVKQLKEQLDVKTVEDAKKKLIQMEKEKEELEIRIRRKFKKLDEEYEC